MTVVPTMSASDSAPHLCAPGDTWHASNEVSRRRNPFDDDPTRPAVAAAAGELKLLWVGEGTVSALVLGSGGIVGRGAEADIRIDDGSLSREHARLSRTPDGVRVDDLGSTNGIWVQGQKLPPKGSAEVRPGESLRLGDVLLLLHHAAVVDRLGVSERPVSSSRAPAGAVVADEQMRTLHRMIDQVAPAPISVLLLGETGVGKEVFARRIHERSERRDGPFVAVNCPALPESLVEGELFGHEKGAFTGADAARAGLLEDAHGGTVFLDEVGDLPLPIQAKLLRVLEDRPVTRVGGRQTRAIDVRFVAATNRDLDEESSSSGDGFRRDLYFRLSGVVIDIPPLRDRPSEIQPLAQYFLDAYCELIGRAGRPQLTADALAHLRAYRWPGNIRELRNAIERATLLCGDGPIRPEHLPLRGKRSAVEAPAPATPPSASGSLTDEVEALEKQRILEALDACAGNQSKAAKQLGISRRSLLIKLDKYDVKRPRR